jgi:TRAP-type C4-dicarboxylate transport system permease small subunit
MLKAVLVVAAIKVALLFGLLAEASADALSEAMKALSDALAAGELNPIMAVVAGLAVVAILVLKALGKNVPFVDPLVKAVLGVAKNLTAKKPAPADVAGVEKVVEVEKIGKQE